MGLGVVGWAGRLRRGKKIFQQELLAPPDKKISTLYWTLTTFIILIIWSVVLFVTVMTSTRQLGINRPSIDATMNPSIRT